MSGEVFQLKTLTRVLSENVELAEAKWVNPDWRARLARLPALRDCLRGISELVQRARQIEAETLTLLYQRETPDPAFFEPDLEKVERERRRLIRAVYRFQQDHPDDVVLAVFGEPQAAFLEFAAAYRQLAAECGQIVSLHYFMPPPGGRSSGTQLAREIAEKPESFQAAPPAKAIGMVMHACGDLIFPRFRGEAGLRLIKEKNHERVCLVEVSAPPGEDYRPPVGIERAGAIKAKGAPWRRVFDRDKRLVKDSELGERPWQGGGLPRCLAALIEDRFERELEAMTK